MGVGDAIAKLRKGKKKEMKLSLVEEKKGKKEKENLKLTRPKC
jgi:hypothetical protein